MIETAGSDKQLILLGNGSESEVISSFSLQQVEQLKTLINANSRNSIVASELFTNIRVADAAKHEVQVVAVRGVSDDSLKLRNHFSIQSGRMFSSGRRELIVGDKLVSRFPWLGLNQKITLGSLEWTIVGVFATTETVAESEVWGEISLLQDAYNRGAIFQSIRVGVEDAANAQAIVNILNQENNRINLVAKTQRHYYAGQIDEMIQFVDIIAIPSIIILILATGFSTLQSMHTMIEARQRETAVLRAIGFSSLNLATSIYSVTILISIAGSVVGILLTLGIFLQSKAVILNHLSLSEVVFPFSITWQSALIAVLTAITIAFVGGLPPTFISLNRSIVTAIRKG
ncbi:FtsX-like permease family protein [Pseudoalteromonas sp. CnMc7-37]|nr:MULTISPECIES: FtsX-like permease family protein [Pseudoalteromonas]MCO7205806.1 FtsX-like permease family protein [Pseudoalteromonas sp. CnMc7-37]